MIQPTRNDAEAASNRTDGSPPRSRRKSLVIPLGRVQQFFAQGLEARHVQQLAFAHRGEVLVNGSPGLAEVGLGLGTLAVDQHGADGEGHDSRDQEHRRPGHQWAVSPRPPRCPPRHRLAPAGYWLVGHPPLHIFGQGPRVRVAVLGLQRHRLQAGCLERPVDPRVNLPGRPELAPLHRPEHRADVVPLERRPAGQQAVERGPQAVNVAPRSQLLEVAAGLLGAHVSRRAQRAARQRLGAAAGRARHQRPFARGVQVGLPEALARPQSTTRVSPCRPTMMLPGLMSRWRTPRPWA